MIEYTNNFWEDKETLAVSVDQTVLLGVDIGYMVVYRGNAFAPINQSNFPIPEKTIQVSGSYGTPDGS